MPRLLDLPESAELPESVGTLMESTCNFVIIKLLKNIHAFL
jgi:hypothetical protein